MQGNNITPEPNQVWIFIDWWELASGRKESKPILILRVDSARKRIIFHVPTSNNASRTTLEQRRERCNNNSVFNYYFLSKDTPVSDCGTKCFPKDTTFTMEDEYIFEWTFSQFHSQPKKLLFNVQPNIRKEIIECIEKEIARVTQMTKERLNM